MNLSGILESLMLLCFGAAWPVSIRKSLKSRTTKGKSLGFMVVVFTGYLFGIAYKLAGSLDAVIFLYTLNCTLVAVDILLFMRNRRFDMLSGNKAA